MDKVRIYSRGGIAVSYEIQYTQDGNRRYVPIKKPSYRIFVLLLCAVFLTVGAYRLMSTESSGLLSFLLPGCGEETGASIQQMLNSIREGESITDAVTTFCMDIISNAK